MWQAYFKVIGIQPGRVVTPRHGCLDFSSQDLPVETLKELYEEGFPYLKITRKGRKELYGTKLPETEEIDSENGSGNE